MKLMALGFSLALISLTSSACLAMIPIVPQVPARPPSALTPSLPQTQAATKTLQSVSDDELSLAIFAKLGDVCFEAENYEAAVRFYRQALLHLDRADATKLAKCSAITGTLSIALFALADVAGAEKYSRMSLNAALNAKPRDPVDISISYNNLAYLNKMVKKYSQSERLYELAVANAPKVSTDDRVRAATIEANLAEVYEINGKLSKAAAAYQHSLEALETELSSEHAAVLELKQLIQQFVLRHGSR